jgi:hypothetical protein
MEMKAAAVIFMRGLFKNATREQEKAFLAQLTDEEALQYKNALPVSWLPMEAAASILSKGARILYPGDPAPLQTFTRSEADNDLKGVYRVLLKVINIPALVNQTAKLWEKYYKQGKARTEADLGAKRAVMFVEGFPDFPAELRETVTGYLYGALDLTGVKQIKISQDAADPQSWKWIVTWG